MKHKEQMYIKAIKQIDVLMQLLGVQMYRLLKLRKGLEQRAYKEGYDTRKIPKYPGL